MCTTRIVQLFLEIAAPPRPPPPCLSSYSRPGGGLGTFPNWDLPFLAWLAREGIHVDMYSQHDVAAEPGLLSTYRLLLRVGHDEYWSAPELQAVRAFVAAGGNVAFFSGNNVFGPGRQQFRGTRNRFFPTTPAARFLFGIQV